MTLAFHHFFVWTQENAPAVEYLISRGFAEGSPNTHPGQGTSNRRIFFSNGMLEFLWISDPNEAQSSVTSPTRLFERSRYAQSGYSPFGICVCPAKSGGNTPPFDGWAYRPRYLPAGTEISVANNHEIRWEPMIFFIAGAKPLADVRPQAEPVTHPNGAGAIREISVSMDGPSGSESDALRTLRAVDRLRLTSGSPALARIAIDRSGPREILDLTAWCPLVIELS
jgi:hypothetical protein